MTSSKDELVRNELVNNELAMLQSLVHRPKVQLQGITPPDQFLALEQCPDDVSVAHLLNNRPLACIIVAGGQGSRLNFHKAKALLPITEEGTTLLQLRLETLKTFAAAIHLPLFVAIMTSDATTADIQAYLHENNNFGIQELHLFEQGSLPLLTMEGMPLDNARGPDGNGWLFHWFDKADLFTCCKQQGIKTLSICLIDNPLADPFHPTMLYNHIKNQVDTTWAAIRRATPTEKVGLFVEHKGSLKVVEYSELNDIADSTGVLSLELANVSQFLIECTAAESIKDLECPLHIAHKTLHHQPILKFERFIFDILPALNKCQLVEIDRERYFHPIKTAHDIDSLSRAKNKIDY